MPPLSMTLSAAVCIRFDDGNEEQRMLLRSAVKHTLDRAAEAHVRAIAVPGIGKCRSQWVLLLCRSALGGACCRTCKLG